MSSPTGTAASTSSASTGVSVIALPDFDFSDQRNYSAKLTAVNVVILCIVIVSVSLRCGVRAAIIKAIGIDDVLIIGAAMANIILCAMVLHGVQLGFGQHVWLIAPVTEIFDQVKRVIKVLFICQIFYATGTSLAKLSIIALYLRIFPSKIFGRVVLATGFVVIAMWICSICVTIFQCSPVPAAWDFQIRNARCVSFIDFSYASGSINALTDLTLCLAPLPMVYRLQVSLKEKIIVLLLFGLGLFASSAAIIRTIQLQGLNSQDITFSLVSSLAWSVIEVGIGIFCPCVPCLRPLLTKALPFLSTRRGTSGHSSRSGPKCTTRSDRASAHAAFELASRPDLAHREHRLGHSVKISAGADPETIESIGLATTPNAGTQHVEEREVTRGWSRPGGIESTSEEVLIQEGVEDEEVGRAI